MRQRMRRFRWPVLVAAGVLTIGSGTAYAVTTDRSTANYRTVAATRGDVAQVLQTSGTVDAAHRADLGFGTSGTVAAVKVAVGDTVKAGQVIATLDSEALEAAVTKAKASLARAVAQLASDEDAQAQTVADAVSSSQTKPRTKPRSKPQGSAPTSPTGGGATSAALAALETQQAAVTRAQTAAGAAVAAAKAALAAQTSACADAYRSTAPTDDDAAQSDATDDDAACSAALSEVQARQDDVAAAQDTLAKALSSLAGTLTKAIATLASSSTATDARTTADTSSSSSDTPTGDTPSSPGRTVTAAQLASDQASIEQTRADLVDARQQLRQAVLRSTRAGRVVALDVAKGDDVSAGDTVATVVGGKAVTIVTTIPESRIDQVRVGQHVRVTTPGEPSAADGTVTAIGLVADSSSGTASFPVTITVEDPTIALPAGSEAMLAIVVATAHDVVTVPTSAVTRRGDGADAFVQTWDGKTLRREAVTIGSVGARTVEVTTGLSAGERVVLADVDRAITGASDEINDRGGFGRAPVLRMDKGGPGGGGPVTFRSGG